MKNIYVEKFNVANNMGHVYMAVFTNNRVITLCGDRRSLLPIFR